ncbi:hypothetical protein [Bacteroides pyogenes]|jgi:hypothetical protein|uniref:Porin n=1 Tax=Bacteroides pyogenes TaxID=310300 RepID=A0A5D3FGK9_9BACE|nr:hypothetical protein [Bacteroides pyogenes]MBR8709885.1 hypothetical protein [Bacteroides pyogenes]MBR8718783.1 hypothetical protein [Bacteroides pyogenes]MBR8748244.1 hypothetical protein [Bacteroides pyogenes]MBR8758530.1 hypothetical protein [Bacteroides pyogenes]MBR8781757.1 hypothetical protein [Bacteroides pyogenes]
MKYPILISLFLLVVGTLGIHAQKNNGALRISGYLNNSTLFASTHPDLLEETLWQNITYQRMNVDWRPHSSIRIEVGIRNLLYTGNATILSYVKDNVDRDRGWGDFSWNIFSRRNILYHLNIDRCSFQYICGAWEVKAGRQRINWGQTLVWNPNNIFNPYSFFQFYYPEHPGCDAIRATYYHNVTSYSELAASLNMYGKPTVALLHSRQANSVEYRFMGGIYCGEDVVMGGSLNLGGERLILRMESSYFHPLKHKENNYDILQAAIGTDYVFSNNLVIQGEVLYSSRNTDTDMYNLHYFYIDPQSAKDLSVSRWSVLAQAVYPLTPRFSTRISGAYFVDKHLCYAGLYFNYRISKNMEASLFSHLFNYADEQPIKLRVGLGFLQYKWIF